MTLIPPTVGRIVWFRDESNQEGQPYAAIVTYVHNDRLVSLTVFHPNLPASNRTYVQLVQEGDAVEGPEHCTWMPYQLGQAKKEEK